MWLPEEVARFTREPVNVPVTSIAAVFAFAASFMLAVGVHALLPVPLFGDPFAMGITTILASQPMFFFSGYLDRIGQSRKSKILHSIGFGFTIGSTVLMLLGYIATVGALGQVLGQPGARIPDFPWPK